MKKLFIIALLFLVAFGAVVFVNIYTTKSTKIKDGRILYPVDGFKYVEPGTATCEALLPECGYCPGEVIDKKCYSEIKQ